MALLVAIWREWIREVDATEPPSTIILDPSSEAARRIDPERHAG